jgi:exonuclease III
MSGNMDDNLKIVSLNVRGLANLKKRRSIFNWCKRSYTDLILLQETHSTSDVETQWRHEWGGNIYFSHGTHNRGVYIGESVRTISDIMDYTKYNDIPGSLPFLDFEKSF